VRDLDLAILGRESRLWRTNVDHLERGSAHWDAMSLRGRLHRVCAPTLLLLAATDVEDDPLRDYLELVADPCREDLLGRHRFVLGAHDHGGAVYAPFADAPSSRLVRAMIGRYLLGAEDDVAATPPVLAYVRGAGHWVGASGWPVHDREEMFHLAPSPSSSDGDLVRETYATSGEITYVSDPEVDDPAILRRSSGSRRSCRPHWPRRSISPAPPGSSSTRGSTPPTPTSSPTWPSGRRAPRMSGG
jgi:hypothetical protein